MIRPRWTIVAFIILSVRTVEGQNISRPSDFEAAARKQAEDQAVQLQMLDAMARDHQGRRAEISAARQAREESAARAPQTVAGTRASSRAEAILAEQAATLRQINDRLSAEADRLLAPSGAAPSAVIARSHLRRWVLMAGLRVEPTDADEPVDGRARNEPTGPKAAADLAARPLASGLSRGVLLAANTSNPAARQVLRDAIDQVLKGTEKGLEIKSKLKPYLKPLEEASKVPDALDRPDGPVNSDSEMTNKLRALGRTWNRELSPLASRTVVDWTIWSGLNALDLKTSNPAVRKLEGMVEELEHRRLIYQAGQSTVIALWGMDYLTSVKGLANGLISTTLLDWVARRETLEVLARGEFLATQARDRAARALDDTAKTQPLSRAIDKAVRSRSSIEPRLP